MSKKVMTYVLILIAILVLFFLMYMKKTCTGLWEQQNSEIYSILSKKEDIRVSSQKHNTCVYVGLSGVYLKWKRSHFVSSDGAFSFDYPDRLGHKTIGSNYIKHEVNSDLIGPTGTYISWQEISIEADNDYWGKQKVNKNGISYNFSEDQKFLTFRLKEHKNAIRFDVTLPGGSMRKNEIINTIINSFEEGPLK